MKAEIFKIGNDEYKTETNFSLIKSALIKMMIKTFEADKKLNNDYTEMSIDFAQFVNNLVCSINNNEILEALEMVTGYAESLPNHYHSACKLFLDNTICNKK